MCRESQCFRLNHKIISNSSLLCPKNLEKNTIKIAILRAFLLYFSNIGSKIWCGFQCCSGTLQKAADLLKTESTSDSSGPNCMNNLPAIKSKHIQFPQVSANSNQVKVDHTHTLSI